MQNTYEDRFPQWDRGESQVFQVEGGSFKFINSNGVDPRSFKIGLAGLGIK